MPRRLPTQTQPSPAQAVTLDNILHAYLIHPLREMGDRYGIAVKHACFDPAASAGEIDAARVCDLLYPSLPALLRWERNRYEVRNTIPEPMKLVISALAAGRTPDGEALTPDQWAEVCAAPDPRIRAAAIVALGMEWPAPTPPSRLRRVLHWLRDS